MHQPTLKPTTTRYDSLGASAALYIGAQSNRVTAGTTALVGSVGVRSLLIDSSQLFTNAGLRVIPLTTGRFKGVGLPGVAIGDDQVAHFQGLVDEAMKLFVADLQAARKLSKKQLESVTTAAVFTAPPAKDIGLIDAVEDIDLLSSETEKGSTMSSQPSQNLFEEFTAFLKAHGLRLVADEPVLIPHARPATPLKPQRKPVTLLPSHVVCQARQEGRNPYAESQPTAQEAQRTSLVPVRRTAWPAEPKAENDTAQRPQLESAEAVMQRRANIEAAHLRELMQGISYK